MYLSDVFIYTFVSEKVPILHSHEGCFQDVLFKIHLF